MLDLVAEFPNLAAAAQVVAKGNGVGGESVRRWHLQVQMNAGQRRGATIEELTATWNLKAEVSRL